MTTLQRQALRRRMIREGAVVSLVLALTLWIFASLPYASDHQLAKLEATAAPNVAALSEREAVEAQQKTPEPVQPTPQVQNEPLAKPGMVIRNARITTYQAVAGQTDATPCVGAMAGVDFCEPPFPIVANNCLPLGTKVEIGFNRYTVADRMNSRHSCNVFDILTDGDNFTLTEDVYVL